MAVQTQSHSLGLLTSLECLEITYIFSWFKSMLGCHCCCFSLRQAACNRALEFPWWQRRVCLPTPPEPWPSHPSSSSLAFLPSQLFEDLFLVQVYTMIYLYKGVKPKQL